MYLLINVMQIYRFIRILQKRQLRPEEIPDEV